MVKECSLCGSKTALEARFCPACGARFKEHVESYDAFISYRREGGSHIAALLKLLLEKEFNKRVFLDVDELQVGRFDERLLELIGRAPNFILVLSGGCLERCVDKNDWLKREIVHAFERRRNIIPILLEGFDFPSGSRLELMPRAMRVLPNLQAVSYSHIHRESVVRRIAEYMVASIPAEETPTPQPDPEPSAAPEAPPPLRADQQSAPSSTSPTPASPPVVEPPLMPEVHHASTASRIPLAMPTLQPPQMSRSVFTIAAGAPTWGAARFESLRSVSASGSQGGRPVFGSVAMSVLGDTEGGARGGPPAFGGAKIRIV